MMICGYGHHGYGICALELFDEMLDSGEDPNCVTFVGVLRACGHPELVEEGFYYLNEFMKHKGVKPGLEHYRCIIIMLIKARKVHKALNFIVSTPSKWDVFAWTNLVGGCLAQSKYTLINRVAKLIPDDVVTKLSKSCGVTDVHAGELMEILVSNEQHRSSWIDEGRFGSRVIAPLYMGDPGFDELHEDMKRLRAYVKRVTNRADEVEDELNSTCEAYHSEEIAIAYAVKNPSRSVVAQTIRVIKASGKICPACHSFIKSVSRAFCRDIIVRDAYHFHTFQDGHCSCGDYW